MPSVDITQAHEVFLGDKPTYIREVVALDPSLYYLTQEEAAFFKAVTGIDHDDELKAHILMTQEKAYKVAPYPCIYGFGFLRMGIMNRPGYEDFIKIGRERKDAIFLDIGCCFATDARKAAIDGFPAHNIIASDLREEFLELSHILFRTSKDTWPAHFIPGDAFDPAMLSVVPPARGPKQEPPPDLSTLTSLNPLHGHCSVINAAAFFHLFDEERQLHLARALAGLLSPDSGSTICGFQVGSKEKGSFPQELKGARHEVFAHSPKSWEEMWSGMVFEKGEVQVRTELIETMFLDIQAEFLSWSITRL
ncbi:hypothetical protein J3A83DRAFT_41200 [Scleroderma citrinum]